jgi:predicted amidophosphoribosyltransferase
MDKVMNKICLKCSKPVDNGAEDYCWNCLGEMHKTASENKPETLREAVDETANKFQIPKSKRIKKDEPDWIF